MIVLIPNHDVRARVIKHMSSERQQYACPAVIIDEDTEVIRRVSDRYSCSESDARRIWDTLVLTAKSLLLSSFVASANSIIDKLRRDELGCIYFQGSANALEIDASHPAAEVSPDLTFDLKDGDKSIPDLEGLLGEDGSLNKAITLYTSGSENGVLCNSVDEIIALIHSTISQYYLTKGE